LIYNSDPSTPDLFLYREQLYSLFELDPGKVLLISAKLGTGVKQLLDAVVQEFIYLFVNPFLIIFDLQLY